MTNDNINQKSGVVSALSLMIEEDKDLMRENPSKGTIQPNWGAKKTWGVVQVGPISEERGYHAPYLESISFVATSLNELEKKAAESGLRVVENGEYDLDGIIEKHYAFALLK